MRINAQLRACRQPTALQTKLENAVVFLEERKNTIFIRAHLGHKRPSLVINNKERNQTLGWDV